VNLSWTSARSPFGSSSLEQRRNIAAFEMSLCCAIPFRQFPLRSFQKDDLNPPGTRADRMEARGTKRCCVGSLERIVFGSLSMRGGVRNLSRVSDIPEGRFAKVGAPYKRFPLAHHYKIDLHLPRGAGGRSQPGSWDPKSALVSEGRKGMRWSQQRHPRLSKARKARRAADARTSGHTYDPRGP
jgi:hypothetical protein